MDSMVTCLLMVSTCCCLVTCHAGAQYMHETRNEATTKIDLKQTYDINMINGVRPQRQNNMVQVQYIRSKWPNNFLQLNRSKRQNKVAAAIRSKRQYPTKTDNVTFVEIIHRNGKISDSPNDNLASTETSVRKNQPTFDPKGQNDTINKVQSDVIFVSKQMDLSKTTGAKTQLAKQTIENHGIHPDEKITQEEEIVSEKSSLEAADTGPQNSHPHQPMSSKPPLKLVLSVVGAVLFSVVLTGVIRWRVKKRLEAKRIAQMKETQHTLEVMNPAMRNQREWAMDTIVECDEGAENSPRQTRLSRSRKSRRVRHVASRAESVHRQSQIANSGETAHCSRHNGLSEPTFNNSSNRASQGQIDNQDSGSTVLKDDDANTEEPLLGNSEESMTSSEETERQCCPPGVTPPLLQRDGSSCQGGSRGILTSLLDTWRSLPFNRDWVGKHWLELHNVRRISDVLLGRHHASSEDVRDEEEEEDSPQSPAAETEIVSDMDTEGDNSTFTAVANHSTNRNGQSHNSPEGNENLQNISGLIRSGEGVTNQEETLLQEHSQLNNINSENASMSLTTRDCGNLNLNTQAEAPASLGVTLYTPDSDECGRSVSSHPDQTDQPNEHFPDLVSYPPFLSADALDLQTTIPQLHLLHGNQQPPPDYREFPFDQSPQMSLASVSQTGNNRHRHRRSKSTDRQRVSRHYYRRSSRRDSVDGLSNSRTSTDVTSRHLTQLPCRVTRQDDDTTCMTQQICSQLATGSTMPQSQLETQPLSLQQNNPNSEVISPSMTNNRSDSTIPQVVNSYPHHEGVVIEQLADGSQIIFLPPPTLPSYYQDTPPPYQE